MSASQDKKKRTQQRAEGTERRQVAAQKQMAEKKKERLKWTIGTILVVLLIAGILLGNSNLFYRQKALQVGDETFSAAQMNYYTNTAYQNWYSQYGSYIQYMVDDPSAPIKTQPCTMSDEYETWGDYFIGTAKESLKQIVAMSQAAKEEGLTLSDEEMAQIDEEIQSFADYAKSSDFGSAKKYMQAVFGQGVNEKIVRQEMERSMLATKYAQSVQDGFTYTKDELAKEYENHKDEFDRFDAMYYFVAAETVESENENGETVNETTDETMAEAKKTADAILEAIKEAEDDEADIAERFTKAVAELGAATPVTDENGEETGEETPAEPTTLEGVTGSDVGYQAFAEWLLDGSRKAGDITVYEAENNGYYVVLFQNRAHDDSVTVNVRHILIRAADADDDGTISDEEKAAAKEKMDKIQDEWNAGEKTEEAFAALADEYSEDPGSNTNGGLYENVYEGQMVAEFNDFCFADGRKAGDVDLVYSESTGWHLIYFCGEGMPYADFLAESHLRSEDFSEWQESFMEGWETTDLRGMKYVE